MIMQELQQQVLRLSPSDRWQLVQWILSLLKRDNLTQAVMSQSSEQKQYPLRGLPLTIGEDFDEPMPELWDALGQ
jgi:hypothetical protein